MSVYFRLAAATRSAAGRTLAPVTSSLAYTLHYWPELRWLCGSDCGFVVAFFIAYRLLHCRICFRLFVSPFCEASLVFIRMRRSSLSARLLFPQIPLLIYVLWYCLYQIWSTLFSPRLLKQATLLTSSSSEATCRARTHASGWVASPKINS